MENESVTSKFFKNCLFEEDYYSEMRKPFLKNYLRQNNVKTNKLFLLQFKRSIMDKTVSPKKKIQNLEILDFVLNLENQHFLSNLLDSVCWKQMKKVSIAYCKPRYDASLPKKFGEFEYSDFWDFGRELLNTMISLGTDFGEFEDDQKTNFGEHYDEIIRLMKENGKPTKIPGHRVSFSESELEGRNGNALDSLIASQMSEHPEGNEPPIVAGNLENNVIVADNGQLDAKSEEDKEMDLSNLEADMKLEEANKQNLSKHSKGERKTKTVTVVKKHEKYETCPDLKKINTALKKEWDSKIFFTRVLKVTPIFETLKFTPLGHYIVRKRIEKTDQLQNT